MIRLKQWILPSTGLGLAALVLVLATPRAAHAVAAALVQVTNTSANPAVTQDISKMASQMVHLYCGGMGANAAGGSCSLISPSASVSSSGYYYSIPQGQSLVITSVDVTGYSSSGATGCSDAITVQLTGFSYWRLAAGAAATSHFTYPPGFAISGVALNGVTILNSTSCGAIANIYGYLTTN